MQDQLVADAPEYKFCDPAPASSTDHDQIGVYAIRHLSDHARRVAVLKNRPVFDTGRAQALAPVTLELLLHLSAPCRVELRWGNRCHVRAVEVDRRGDREH